MLLRNGVHQVSVNPTCLKGSAAWYCMVRFGVACIIHANTPLAIHLMPISCGKFQLGIGICP